MSKGNKRLRSLRWQVSTLLLLSTLTAVFMAALTGLLLTAATSGPTLSVLGEVGTISTVIDDIQSRVMSWEQAPTQQQWSQIKEKFSVIDSRLDTIGEFAKESRGELDMYRRSIDRWMRAWGQTSSEDRERHIQELRAAQRRVRAALIYSAYYSRPEYVDWLLPSIPWIMVWILLMAGFSVWRAFRLRRHLSLPMQILAQAAGRVSAGAFHTHMPIVGGVTEIAELRESVETMRERLVATIGHLDTRKEELKSILENMSDGVLLVDSVGVIKDFNHNVRTLCDKRPGGRPMRLNQKLLQVFPQFPREVLTCSEPRLFEVEMDPHSTPPQILEVYASPVRTEVSAGRVLVLTDVTAARELERLKGTFLSMVTHELKTPLTSVLGYTKLLLRGKGGDLSSRHREYMEIIDAQATQLRMMIQDLLDMSRLESGNLPMNLEPVIVAELLESVMKSHMGMAQQGGVALTLDPRDLGQAKVLADTTRLPQVLSNLIGNAFKFTPEGGKVSLNAGLGPAPKQIWIAVEDTGRGIPQEALPRLFDKFFQVERGDTRVAGGAGLGLYICRELVNAMHGSINVRSTPGQGSRFTVTLPRLTT